MSESSTPRQAIKNWLQGEAPLRPLLMPILFSLGGRLENVELHDFLSNPTKIAKALRQMHTWFKLDGICCYFDPFLEAEALGCVPVEAGSSRLQSLDATGRGKLNSLQPICERGRVPVAREVIRSLKVILADEPALTVRVSGPLALAARLFGDSGKDDDLMLAAELAASITKTFLDAGADVVFLVEESLPEMSLKACETYASLLEPIFNVVRFYGAMPVLVLGRRVSDQTLANMTMVDWQCVLCPTTRVLEASLVAKQSQLGLALPDVLWYGQSEATGFANRLKPGISETSIVLLTSEADIPGSDIKQLTQGLNAIRRQIR